MTYRSEPVYASDISEKCVHKSDKHKHEWVGLTENEMAVCWKSSDIVAAVEAKLKEKNS